MFIAINDLEKIQEIVLKSILKLALEYYTNWYIEHITFIFTF
jgi:hypothetical protein